MYSPEARHIHQQALCRYLQDDIAVISRRSLSILLVVSMLRLPQDTSANICFITLCLKKGETDHQPFMLDSCEFITFIIGVINPVPVAVFDVDSDTSKRRGEELCVFTEEKE